MSKLKDAHEKLNAALKNIDDACNYLTEDNGELHKPKIKKLARATGEILHAQKLIRDDEPEAKK